MSLLLPIDTTIVVATCSRAALLRRSLGSLLAQAWNEAHAVELIVVDDGSADSTGAVLAELQRTSPIPFTVLQGASEGVAAARNLGCMQARGTWIASFDDDQIADPGWLSALRALADSTGAACVGGALELALPAAATGAAELGPRVRRILGEHARTREPRRYSRGELPSTNTVLLRRDVFTALAGFDPSFTEGGEDKDLFARVAAAGHELWFAPASRAQHLITAERLSPANLRWTSLRLGASDVRVLHRTGRIVSPLLHAALRLLLLGLRDLPLLAACTLGGKQSAALDARCSIWYTEGFLRALAPILRGETGEQSAFLRSINFRQRNGERP